MLPDYRLLWKEANGFDEAPLGEAEEGHRAVAGTGNPYSELFCLGLSL